MNEEERVKRWSIESRKESNVMIDDIQCFLA